MTGERIKEGRKEVSGDKECGDEEWDEENTGKKRCLMEMICKIMGRYRQKKIK